MSTMNNLTKAVEKALNALHDELGDEQADLYSEPVETALRELEIPEPSCLDMIRANLHTTVQKDAFIAGVEWARKQLSL